jgi:hypothetical protein
LSFHFLEALSVDFFVVAGFIFLERLELFRGNPRSKRIIEIWVEVCAAVN